MPHIRPKFSKNDQKLRFADNFFSRKRSEVEKPRERARFLLNSFVINTKNSFYFTLPWYNRKVFNFCFIEDSILAPDAVFVEELFVGTLDGKIIIMGRFFCEVQISNSLD